jgi:hypothetical protein
VSGRKSLTSLYRVVPALISLGVGLLILINSYYGMLYGNPVFTFLYRTFLGNIILMLYITLAAYATGFKALEAFLRCVKPRSRSPFEYLVDALLTLSLVPVVYSVVLPNVPRAEVTVPVALLYSTLVVLTLRGLKRGSATPLVLVPLVYAPLTILALLHREAVERNLKELINLLTSLEEVARILGLV